MALQMNRGRIKELGLRQNSCVTLGLSGFIGVIDQHSNISDKKDVDVDAGLEHPAGGGNAVELAKVVGRNKPALAGVSGKPKAQMPETVVARPYSGLHPNLNSTALAPGRPFDMLRTDLRNSAEARKKGSLRRRKPRSISAYRLCIVKSIARILVLIILIRRAKSINFRKICKCPNALGRNFCWVQPWQWLCSCPATRLICRWPNPSLNTTLACDTAPAARHCCHL
jgi:hypothetical protein